jgi:hypothetical protein
VVITEGTRSDVHVARQQRFPPGTILVLDRGYLNHTWFAELTAAGVFFVTRLKTDASYAIVQSRPVPQTGDVVADQEIVWQTKHSLARYPASQPLRRVEVALPDGARLVFLTNNLRLGATTIARIYKERWQIELFFTALKLHPRFRSWLWLNLANLDSSGSTPSTPAVTPYLESQEPPPARTRTARPAAGYAADGSSWCARSRQCCGRCSG